MSRGEVNLMSRGEVNQVIALADEHNCESHFGGFLNNLSLFSVNKVRDRYPSRPQELGM
jgi:hypothetical protein